jgi:hypothetical protein
MTQDYQTDSATDEPSSVAKNGEKGKQREPASKIDTVRDSRNPEKLNADANRDTTTNANERMASQKDEPEEANSARSKRNIRIKSMRRGSSTFESVPSELREVRDEREKAIPLSVLEHGRVAHNFNSPRMATRSIRFFLFVCLFVCFFVCFCFHHLSD